MKKSYQVELTEDELRITAEALAERSQHYQVRAYESRPGGSTQESYINRERDARDAFCKVQEVRHKNKI